MPHTATFNTPCPGCGTRIVVGDPIVHDDEAEGWVHTRCGHTSADDTPTHPLCTRCWIHHPSGVCD